MLFALLLVFCAGAGLGWLGHAARAGQRAAAAEAQLAALRENEQLLRHSLGAASADAARHNSQAIGTLVEPLREALGSLNQHIQQVEHNRINAYSGLREQVAGMQRISQQLSTQTGELVSALRAPQVRGRWGEVTLRRVAELAGMVERCDFYEQETHEFNGARIRPDMIVRLPGGRTVVVDAKVPLAAYLDAVASPDETSRRAALERHARQVAAHLDQLSAKAYWSQFQPAPEFVVLFLPGDHFFSAALEYKPTLIEDGVKRKVLVATPTTLIAMLKGAAYGWRQEQLAESAEQIRCAAAELFDRVQNVHEYFASVGGALAKAVEAYNRCAGSMESRVFPSLRRLRELGVTTSDGPEPPEPVNLSVRAPARFDS